MNAILPAAMLVSCCGLGCALWLWFSGRIAWLWWHAAFDQAPTPMWLREAGTGRIRAVNRAALELSGHTRPEFLTYFSRPDAPDPSVPHGFLALQKGEKGRPPVLAALTVRRLEGFRKVELVSVSLPGLSGWTRSMEDERARILQLVARNEPLEGSLGSACLMIERACPHLCCAIFVFLDGAFQAVAPGSVPEALLTLIDGLPLRASDRRPPSPVWGEALKARLIQSDPLWAPFRETAERNGIAACWCIPLFSGAGEILGVLGAFSAAYRKADEFETELLRSTGGLAAIAIEQHNLNHELFYRAHFDPLTRLANRTGFELHLETAVRNARRSGSSLALLYMDLDRFKLVNDILGHRVGDALLCQVASRIEACTRHSDILARVGGDEFILLVPDLAEVYGAQAAAQKILDALRDPFQIEGQELFASVSIGISIYPRDTADPEILERNADSAMYCAKRNGASSFVLYDGATRVQSPERLETETNLRRALERGEMILYYQPQYSVRSGELCGLEALIRWQHPEIGMISPGTFIPIAEEIGLIGQIGAWTLREACRQQTLWREAGHALTRVAVNVSPLQFEDPDFVRALADVLEIHGVPPGLLELELTEGALLRDPEHSVQQMHRLRELGVRLSIDDFGTGHSSLSYLQRLPADVLKIDQSFIRDIKSAIDRPPLVESIINMAHALAMKTVAEGVETTGQMEALCAMGCDELQGFLLSRPAPPESVFENAQALHALLSLPA